MAKFSGLDGHPSILVFGQRFIEASEGFGYRLEARSIRNNIFITTKTMTPVLHDFRLSPLFYFRNSGLGSCSQFLLFSQNIHGH